MEGSVKRLTRARSNPINLQSNFHMVGLPVMVFLQEVLPYAQIGLSVLLIVCVLMQRTGASLGGAFGADNFSSGFHTRRGLERTLFYATIILAILFAVSALISLFIS